MTLKQHIIAFAITLAVVFVARLPLDLAGAPAWSGLIIGAAVGICTHLWCRRLVNAGWWS